MYIKSVLTKVCRYMLIKMFIIFNIPYKLTQNNILFVFCLLKTIFLRVNSNQTHEI